MNDHVTLANEPTTGRAKSSAPSLMRTIKAYVALTKPRVIELLLVTTVPTMILAHQGLPSFGLMAITLLGGAMAAGSANTMNCYIDRDIDKVMNRTKDRPLATGEISPRNALIFGVVLGIVSLLVLGVGANLLSAALAAAAILFYVCVYTMVLKRRTPSNIVWGGAAGCMPVLIGWSAVTNSLDWAPWILFGVIFLWTPPHYWPLSMKYADDYSSVNVPMLGAVEKPLVVAQRIIRYSWAMVACSFTLVLTGTVGWVYTSVAVITGAVFLLQAHRLKQRALAGVEPLKPMVLFGYSITYLTLLFLAIGADPIITSAPLMSNILP